MKGWISQFRRGFLELWVLNYLSNQADHGYRIVRRLQRIDGLDVRESTVYPILARLNAEGLVKVRKEPSPAGPPRRVFHLTPVGQVRLGSLNAYWDTLAESVNRLRSGDSSSDDGEWT